MAVRDCVTHVYQYTWDGVCSQRDKKTPDFYKKYFALLHLAFSHEVGYNIIHYF